MLVMDGWLVSLCGGVEGRADMLISCGSGDVFGVGYAGDCGLRGSDTIAAVMLIVLSILVWSMQPIAAAIMMTILVILMVGMMKGCGCMGMTMVMIAVMIMVIMAVAVPNVTIGGARMIIIMDGGDGG